jgi:amino acid transporter
MRVVYAVLAWIIAAAVVIQAAAIAFAFGGILQFIEGGGVVDKALVESSTGSFTGELGFPIHSTVGGLLIPILALALVVVSFFARARGARLWALVVFVLVLLQVALGYSVAESAWVGAIHGANALAVFITAVIAAVRIRKAPAIARRRATPRAGETPDSDSVSV